jgi:vacuolar-type H+-ATPase subunit E/Vma4
MKLAASRAQTTVAADEDIAAGVRVEMEDGSLVVDATAESRLARMRGAIAIDLVAALEGKA